MENYICICGQKFELAATLIDKVKAALTGAHGKQLSELEPGDTFKVGAHEFVVLEHCAGETAVIRREILKQMAFGPRNNFDGSVVAVACEEFAAEIAEIIGAQNLVEHTVDLTSDDGLKDYGATECYASLLTAQQYRKYVSILDEHKPDGWWWLATPDSTAAHGCDRFVKCVSPRGDLGNGDFNCSRGVRPFCIFKSNIFVS